MRQFFWSHEITVNQNNSLKIGALMRLLYSYTNYSVESTVDPVFFFLFSSLIQHKPLTQVKSSCWFSVKGGLYFWSVTHETGSAGLEISAHCGYDTLSLLLFSFWSFSLHSLKFIDQFSGISFFLGGGESILLKSRNRSNTKRVQWK